MSIINHTLNKYDMLFHTNLDLLPSNLVYFVLGNGNLFLEMSWNVIFPWLWEPCMKDLDLPNWFVSDSVPLVM